MTRNSFFRFIFPVILFMGSNNCFADGYNAISISVKHDSKAAVTPPAKNLEHDLPLPASPAAQPVEHSKKAQSMKTEELAHIHHFHKERVKKIKRHHKKYWILSKLVLILCHLVLLICAYLHLTH